MAIVRWNPYQPSVGSARWPALWGEELGWPVTSQMSDGLDVYETDDSVVVEAAVPGLREEDINVDFEDGILHIYGERSIEENERKKRRNVYQESGITSFDYMTTLPRSVNADKISADLDDGIVQVSAPITESSKPKKITAKKKSKSKNDQS